MTRRRRQDRPPGPRPSPRGEADYQIVDTPAKLAVLVQPARRSSRRSRSTPKRPTSSPRWAEIVGYSFAWKPGKAFYVPVRGPAGEPVLDPVATLDALRPILENPAIAKIGQNLKYDMIVLRTRRHRARAASRSTR